MDLHRGKLIERFIRKSGFSISFIAKRLGVSRNTLYKYFRQAAINDHIMTAVGCIVGYDFSVILPGLSNKTSEQKVTVLLHLQKDYIDLLERHHRLVLLTFQTFDRINEPEVKEKVYTVLKNLTK